MPSAQKLLGNNPSRDNETKQMAGDESGPFVEPVASAG
jgi:hypothetical protein